MSAIHAWGVVAGLGLGLGLWVLASLSPRMQRPRLARRVAPYLLDVSAGAREAVAPEPPGPLPVILLLAQPIVSRLRPLLGGTQQVARRLRQAGSDLGTEGFRAQQLAWGVAGSAIGVVLSALAVGVNSISAPLAIAIVAGSATSAALAREYALQRAARRRLARLAEELPVVLEFLSLSLSAGEGIVDAVRRVARVGSGDLSVELAGVVASVGTGLPLAQSLADLDRALDLPPLSRCIDQIVVALERGTPLAEVLRAQAQDARDDAKRILIEAAGRKEIAMLFPLVFLILPVTICFAIWPGIAVLQRTF